ncbi:MAG: hypothetical protein ABEH83_04315 [Halobacterium sp.]
MTDFVTELLRDVDETAVDVFDLAERREAKQDAGSRRDAYERGIEEVRDKAGKPQARELAEWIQAEMRDREAYPTAREVRKQGAKLCRESGHEVSTGDWLGA